MKIAAILAASAVIAFVFAASSRGAHAATSAQSNSITPANKVGRSRRTITVQRGDYLYELAKKYSITVQRLFYANTQVKDPNLIYPGEELVVPSADEQLTPRPWPGAGDSPAEPIATPTQSSETDVDSNTNAATTIVTQSTPTPPTATISVAGGSMWDSLAQCESGGNWATNTGNGYYGGLQFTLQSWRAVGGTGYPSEASRTEQIALAQKLLAAQGWSAWPACSARLGL